MVFRFQWHALCKQKIIQPLESTKKNLTFGLNAMGNRIGKKVVQGGMFQNYTAYALDAQGYSMATYDLKMGGGVNKMLLKEEEFKGN